MPPIQNKPPEGEGNPEDKPDFVTKVDFDKSLNGAMKGWGERLTKQVETMVGERLGPILEQLNRPPPDDKKKGDDDLTNTVAKLQQEVATEKKARLEVEERSKAERISRQRDEERSALSAALIEGGVDAKQARFAVADLYGRRVGKDPMIRRDPETNHIHWRVQRESSGGQYVEDLSLADGAAEWLKGDEGMFFMPAKTTGGSGSGGSPRVTKGSDGKPLTPRQQRVADANQVLYGSGGSF